MDFELYQRIFLIFGSVTVITSLNSSVKSRKGEQACHTKLAENSSKACSDYINVNPYQDRKALDEKCRIRFTDDSKEYFTYKVLKYKYRFVKLKIDFCQFDSTVQYTRCAIQPLDWVWTYGGVDGGEQYLEWPAEFETLSLGMLKTYTSLPLHVNVTVQGKCNIVIGEKNTTERFALAFADLYHDLSMTKDQYNYSFWCFKTRIYIESNFLYKLCQQVICPVETIGYKCCQQIFDVNSRSPTIKCPGGSFKFGSVWWACPFVIGVLLYLYFGMMLAFVLSNVYKHLDIKAVDNIFMDIRSTTKSSSQNETTPLIQTQYERDSAFIIHNPVTVLSIIASPIRRCCLFHPITTLRVIRCLVAISSVTVVTVKVVLHYINYCESVTESVKQGAPKDFLSMIAGYELSKTNFLIFLGGPFVALGAYIACFLIFILVPHDLATFLESGIPVSNAETSSPLWMDLKLRERFGSKRILGANYSGYAKIHQTMLANIFALLNPSFWGFVISLQLARFQTFTSQMKRNVFTVVLTLIVGILYVFVCFIELILTLAYFGFPTIFAISVVYKAYLGNLCTWCRDKGSVGICILFVSLPCVYVMLTITVYMFSIIFVDSFIFIAKIVIFTYTGLFVNPSYTEGWVIFGITIIMYMYDSIHSVNETYEQLFEQTKKVCKRKGKRLKIPQHLYKKEVAGATIPRDLYKYIIHTCKPIRVEVFVSVVKICIITFCLYISLQILVNFDGFQELNIVTQTATTIAVSFVPQLLKRMCSLNERRKILRMRRKIDEAVDSYLIYNGINLDQGPISGDSSSAQYPTYNSI